MSENDKKTLKETLEFYDSFYSSFDESYTALNYLPSSDSKIQTLKAGIKGITSRVNDLSAEFKNEYPDLDFSKIKEIYEKLSNDNINESANELEDLLNNFIIPFMNKLKELA